MGCLLLWSLFAVVSVIYLSNIIHHLPNVNQALRPNQSRMFTMSNVIGGDMSLSPLRDLEVGIKFSRAFSVFISHIYAKTSSESPLWLKRAV